MRDASIALGCHMSGRKASQAHAACSVAAVGLGCLRLRQTNTAMTWHLESERLYLRRATLDDEELFFALDSDPEVMRYIGDGSIVTDRKQARAALAERVLVWYERAPGLGLWVCCSREGGRAIGWFCLKECSLSYYDGDRLEPAGSHVELGYRLLRADWGRGYGSEMARALVAYGFDCLRLSEIVAVVLPENRASVRVIQRAGLTYRGPGRYRGRNVDVYVRTS
jgi:RimJ/RimL family protein N-acetyltransferase